MGLLQNLTILKQYNHKKYATATNHTISTHLPKSISIFYKLVGILLTVSLEPICISIYFRNIFQIVNREGKVNLVIWWIVMNKYMLWCNIICLFIVVRINSCRKWVAKNVSKAKFITGLKIYHKYSIYHIKRQPFIFRDMTILIFRNSPHLWLHLNEGAHWLIFT